QQVQSNAGLQQRQTQLLGTGATIRDEVDEESVRDLLAVLTKAAVSDDAYTQLVERMVDQDRNRLSAYADEAGDQGMARLNESAAEFRRLWQDKYGEAFEIDDASQVFAAVRATQAEINDPQAFARNWPVTAVGGGDAMDTADLASSRQPAAG